MTITAPFTANGSVGSAKADRININDTSKFDIVTVQELGSNEQLDAFKAAFGAPEQSVEEFLVGVVETAAELPTARAHELLKPAADGFDDVRTNLTNLVTGHAALARYFPEDELETLEGFVGIMLRNNDAEMQDKYNGFREKLMYVVDKSNGEVAGGTNFGMFIGNNAAENGAVTTHAVYTFVPPEYRQRGMAHALANMRFGETAAFAAEKGHAGAEVFVFSEQNSPLKMTPIEYVQDTAMAVDPVDRLKAWQRVGYMKTGFTYVQPSLGEGLEAVEMLDLHTHIPANRREHFAANGLNPAIVNEHLRNFMELSVMKEEGAFAVDDYCVAMTDELSSMQTLPVSREDMTLLQNKIYAFFALMEEGQLPDPNVNEEFYDRAFADIFADESVAQLIVNRAASITPADIKRMQDGIQGKGDAVASTTAPGQVWALDAA